MELKEITSKSILVKSKLPDTDFVINPYVGCRFGCTYCYASFMGRMVDKKISDWGEYVYAKTNAVELLKKEVRKLKNPKNKREQDIEIFVSSVTDPYQGVEGKYKLTRGCLEVLADHEFQGAVSILTKSDMVLRDIDVLQRLPRAEVGFTITSTDDAISRYFEKYAPNVTARLSALKQLNTEGIKTYAFIGPLLPHYVAQTDEVDKVVKSIADAGTKEVYVEHINLSPYILGRFKKEMKDMDSEVFETFYASKDKSYREALDEIVMKSMKKHGLQLRRDETVYHPEL